MGEQNLALKVMRLTRPSFAYTSSTLPFANCPLDESSETASTSFCDKLQKSTNSSAILSCTLVLPQSFGSIYLGETFVCYVSLHNDSTETCDNLNLRCDLQTASQRLPLLQPQSSSDTESEQIVPGESVDHVLNHEVKECGTHILVCE